MLEVRLAYCNEDFEFDQLERLSKKDMKEANVKLLRAHAIAVASTVLSEDPIHDQKMDD